MKPKRIKIGTKIGKLIIIQYLGIKNGRSFYECKCECGKFKKARESHLKRKEVRSCGCLKAKPKGYSATTFLFDSYKRGAIRRNLKFKISREIFTEFVRSDCYYCGSIPKNELKGKRFNGSLKYNGIDRVDNNKGYEIDNIVTCCKICNMAKCDMSIKDFYLWIKSVNRRINE